MNIRRCHDRRGFTLLEVLLVLAILGVLAAMVVPALLGRQREAMKKMTKASIAGLEKTLKLYAVNNDGEYPEGTSDAVFALLMNPGTDADGNTVSPYLEDLPNDAWGQLLNCESPNSKVPSAFHWLAFCVWSTSTVLRVRTPSRISTETAEHARFGTSGHRMRAS